MQNQVILTPESSHGWNLRYGLSLAQVRKRFLRSLQDSLDGPTGNAGLLGEGLRDLLGPRLRTPRGSLRGPEVPPPGRVFRTPIRRQKPRENWPFGSGISDQTLAGFPLWG